LNEKCTIMFIRAHGRYNVNSSHESGIEEREESARNTTSTIVHDQRDMREGKLLFLLLLVLEGGIRIDTVHLDDGRTLREVSSDNDRDSHQLFDILNLVAGG